MALGEPNCIPIPSYSLNKRNLIFFDLETTGFHLDCEIIQLAACAAVDRRNQYSQYVLPTGGISPGASRVTGLTIDYHPYACCRYLKKDTKEVATVSESEMLKSFLDWLWQDSILCAHNAKSFDVRVFLQALKRNGMVRKAKSKIVGFVDSLGVLKDIRSGEESYRLKDLYLSVIGRTLKDAHDAKDDSDALRAILAKLQPASDVYVRHSVSFASGLQRVDRSNRKQELENNLPDLSEYMVKKIAASGLSFEHLQMAHIIDEERGLKKLLSEKIDGKVRVTSKKATILAIQSSFSKRR